ncbi:MAG: hypothetical protein D4R81_04510 [Nitrospiraceae bacterium]|nr:MAG: hypothetical protein D4R81_04510 [Nitrospiraceae bacterium]
MLGEFIRAIPIGFRLCGSLSAIFWMFGEVIALVLESIATHTPEDPRIVIKNPPLDKGLTNFTRIVRACGLDVAHLTQCRVFRSIPLGGHAGDTGQRRIFCRQGIDLAVQNNSRILTVQRSPLEALL